jgi:hypothetical protein
MKNHITPRQGDQVKKPMKLYRRLTIISDAVNRAETSAGADDVAYLIRHLVFEADLLVRSGVFKNEESKLAVERALSRATNAAKRLA